MGNMTFDKADRNVIRYNGRLRLVDIPYSSTERGAEGDFSFDGEYGYLFSVGQWRRFSLFIVADEDDVPTKFNRRFKGNKTGHTCYNHDYLFIYYNDGWRSIPLLPLVGDFPKKTLSVPLVHVNDIKIMNGRVDMGHGGQDGSVSYDENYFYIRIGFMWRKIPLFLFD